MLATHTLFATNSNICLARIEVLRLTGERNNLYAVEIFICGVGADDDGGTFLADFPSEGGLEINPPDLTSFHGCYP